MQLSHGYKTLQVSPKTQMKVERLDQNKRYVHLWDFDILVFLKYNFLNFMIEI